MPYLRRTSVMAEDRIAENKNLETILRTFRVSELQVLLAFAGKGRSGRKAELLSKALHMVNDPHGVSNSISQKIRELQRRLRTNGYVLAPPAPISTDYAPPPETLLTTPSNHYGPGPAKSLKKNYLTEDSSGTGYGSANVPIYCDVRMKPLPFYDVLDVLLKPLSLNSSAVQRTSSVFHENDRMFVFHVTPTQARQLQESLSDNNSTNDNVQVQIRFCLLETSCEQEDHFPPKLNLKVNAKLVVLPPFIPSNKQGVEPKRPNRAVNITPYCKLSSTAANQVQVMWSSEYQAYAVSVYLVRQLNAHVLLQRLRGKCIRNADHTRALIKEKLQHDPDSEIATTSLRVSLICPLGKMPITMPCRSSTCSHLQCFDASCYLQMNERKPTWICPVCDKKATYEQLIIDGLFLQILKHATGSREIQFYEDGSWQPIHDEIDHIVVASPSRQTAPTIDLCDGLAINNIGNQSVSVKEKEVDVIDLTEDSSDEDDEEETVVDNIIPKIYKAPLSVSSDSSSPPVICSDTSSPLLTSSSLSNQQSAPLPLLTNQHVATAGSIGGIQASIGASSYRLRPESAASSSSFSSETETMRSDSTLTHRSSVDSNSGRYSSTTCLTEGFQQSNNGWLRMAPSPMKRPTISRPDIISPIRSPPIIHHQSHASSTSPSVPPQLSSQRAPSHFLQGYSAPTFPDSPSLDLYRLLHSDRNMVPGPYLTDQRQPSLSPSQLMSAADIKKLSYPDIISLD